MALCDWSSDVCLPICLINTNHHLSLFVCINIHQSRQLVYLFALKFFFFLPISHISLSSLSSLSLITFSANAVLLDVFPQSSCLILVVHFAPYHASIQSRSSRRLTMKLLPMFAALLLLILSIRRTSSLTPTPASDFIHASSGLIFHYLSSYAPSNRIVSLTVSIPLTQDMCYLLPVRALQKIPSCHRTPHRYWLRRSQPLHH